MSELPNVIPNATITSEHINDVKDRSVQRYPSFSGRTSGHPGPVAGDTSYLQDTGDVDVYHAGAWRHVGPPVGTIIMHAGGSTPIGWLVCNGALVSRATYSRLFAQIGTAFGAGDGSTTFALPDMRQRFPLGVAASGTGDTVGEKGGQIDHVHTGPSHIHAQAGHTHVTTGTTAGASGGNHHQHGFTSDPPNSTYIAREGTGPTMEIPHPQHRHTGPTDNAGGHNHSYSDTTTSSGGNNTQASGTANTGTKNPPYLALFFLIKT